jgi:oligoribonuclease NrnB/cAMP/cGMP phosphodiesterase (DHH superfamily)
MDIYSREDIPEDKKHIYLDDQIHFMKKRFFRRKKDDTLDNMLTDYIVNLLTKNRKNMTVTYKGYKGLLSSMIGNISLVGNGFLLKNPDYDFFIDVSGRGNVSIRANGKVNVSIMAQELGSGGGHVNASGGRIKGHRDSYLYSVILESVQSIMTEREYLETTLPNKKETREDEKEPDNSFSNKIDLSMFKR